MCSWLFFPTNSLEKSVLGSRFKYWIYALPYIDTTDSVFHCFCESEHTRNRVSWTFKEQESESAATAPGISRWMLPLVLEAATEKQSISLNFALRFSSTVLEEKMPHKLRIKEASKQLARWKVFSGRYSSLSTDVRYRLGFCWHLTLFQNVFRCLCW